MIVEIEKCMSAIENACVDQRLKIDEDCLIDIQLNAWGQYIVKNLYWKKDGKIYKPFLKIKCDFSLGVPIPFHYVCGSIDNEGFSSGDISMFKKEYRVGVNENEG